MYVCMCIYIYIYIYIYTYIHSHTHIYTTYCVCVSVYGGEERCIQGFGGKNLKERDHLGDRGLDARIILRWIFSKWDVGYGLDRVGSG